MERPKILPHEEYKRLTERGSGSLQPDGAGYRLCIEAVGLRQSDAAAFALRLIGMMIQDGHTKGYSCGGETGNASGNWEKIGSPNAPVSGSALAPSSLPVPKAVYPCSICHEDYSWPPEDLRWSEKSKKWVCDMCWNEEYDGTHGPRLADVLQAQNDQAQARRATDE